MRALRIAGVVLASITILVVIALIVAQAPPTRRYVLSKVRQQLHASGIDLQASGLDYNLAGGSVTVRDVVVRSKATPDLPPIATADYAHVEIAVLPLLTGDIVIRDGELRHPVIHVVTTADNRTNIPRPEKKQEDTQTRTEIPNIDRLRITDASLTYEDRAKQMIVTLPRWQVAIDGRPTGANEIRLETQQPGEFSSQGRALAIHSINLLGTLAASTQHAEIRKLALDAQGLRLDAAGTIQDFSDPAITGKAQSAIDLGTLRTFLGTKEKMTGTMNLRVAAEGKLADLHLGLQASSSDLQVAGINQVDLSADANYRGQQQLLHLASLNLQTSNGSLRGTGDIALNDTGTTSLEARVQRLDLLRITRALNLPMKVASTASGTIKASFPGTNFKRADGRAQLVFTRLRSLPAENVLPLSGTVRAVARDGAVTLQIGTNSGPSISDLFAVQKLFKPAAFASDPTVHIEPAILRMSLGRGLVVANDAGQTSFRRTSAEAARSQSGDQATAPPSQPPSALSVLSALLKGQLTLTPEGRISGRLTADFEDLQSTLDRLQLLLGRPTPLVPMPVHGRARAVVDLSGTTKDPTANLTLSGPRLSVGQLQGVAVAVNALYEPAGVDIRKAHIAFQDATIDAKGRLGLKGNNPPLDLTANLNRVSIPALLALAQKQNIAAAGVLTGNTRITGTTKSPNANFSLRGENVTVYAEPFGQVEMRGTLRDNNLNLTQLTVAKPDGGRLNASGQYNLASGAYTLTANSQAFTIHNLQLPNGNRLSMSIDLNASGTGTKDDPKLKGQFVAHDVKYGDRSFGDVRMDLAVANRLADIRAEVPQYNLNANANVGTVAPYAARFNVNTDRLDLSRLRPVAQAIKGQVTVGTVTANVQGTANLSNAVETADVTASVQQLEATRNDIPIRLLQPLVARYRRLTVNIDPTTLVAGASRLTVGGTIPLQGASTGSNLQITGLVDLASAVQLAPPAARKLDAAGQMQLDMTLRGSLKQLAPEGTLALRNARIAGEQLPAAIENINLQAAVGNGMAAIESLTAQFASAQISASGRLPFSLLPAAVPIARGGASGPASFRADVKGFQLASLKNTPKNVNGQVSLHLEATAPRLDLNSLQALLRFDQLQLQFTGVAVNQQGLSTFAVRNGRATIERFQLQGPSTDLVASGSANLTGDRALNLRIDGNTNAEIASLFVEAVQMRGPVRLQVAVGGTASAPNLQGSVNMRNGIVSLREPRVDITALNLQMAMRGQRIELAQLTGNMNGGTLTGGGGFEIGKGGIAAVDLDIKGNEVYLNFPEGMKTVSNLNLNLRSAENDFVLGGEVQVTEGSFRRNLNLESQAFMRALQGDNGSEIQIAEQRSPFLERIRFNTALSTTAPILIDNNLAKLGIETTLRLVGGFYNPSLLGRVQLEEGGEIRFQQITAYVDRGVVTFVSEARIQPVFDIQARTQASGYDITMQITGPPDKTETTFTSNPPLPQPDIISVLVFGRTLQDVRGSEVQVAQQQALSLLAGGLGSALSNRAENALGLSEVRLEPSLLGGEANPTARITIGEDITRQLRLVYSMDVVNTADRIVFGEYDVTRRFTTRATKQADNSYRFDLNHDFRFGGETTEDLRFRSRPERKIGEVTFRGETYFEIPRLREVFDLKTGDDYDFFKVRDKMDKLQSFFRDRQFLEASVRLRRRENPGTVDLNIFIQPGKKVTFAYEGFNLPGSVQKDVRRIWTEGVFDLQRGQEASGAISNELLKRNYIDSQVSYEIQEAGADLKRVVFRIAPGTQYRELQLDIQGAREIDADELTEAIKDNNLREKTITDFGAVQEFLEGYYRSQGYLTVDIGESRLVTDANAGTARLIIPIDEGPQYTVGGLGFEGKPIFPYPDLWRQVPELWTGRPYIPANRDPALLKVQTFYWNAGYVDAEIDYRAVPHPEQAKVDVIFTITPNEKSIVQSIDINGTDQTDTSLIRRQVLLREGQSLDYDRLSESRVNLYQTNAFELVELDPIPLGDKNPGNGTRPVALRVNVREVEPFQWQYGAYFDTERGPGAISDFANHNTLGAGRVLGLFTRYDRDRQEARLYFNQPLLRRLPRTNFAGYYNRNTHYNPGTDDKTFVDDQFGFAVDQEIHFKKDYILTYGYRIERSRVMDLTEAVPPGDATNIVAPLTFGFTRERRDDLVNPTRGDFFSQGLLTGFGFLGSSQRYIKYTGQYNQYLSLNKPTQIPFKKAYKSRLVYAGAVRIGIAGGLGGQDLIQTERFFAGGGTTLRGFKQDEVGPKSSVGNPLGGNAMFILNNELRFPLWKWFDGAGFIDVGNVYREASDFNPTDLRKSAGVGLRVYTPFVLIRADYGLKLDRRTGESAGAFFVSIGQAF